MHTLTARELQERFVTGKTSAVAITEHFLHRIELYDKKIGAFLTVYKERALKQAKALDEKLARGEKVGRLAAVPIALKDNIHIKGEITTCASRFLTNYKAPFDATVTTLLEKEDAIFIGKTNMDEFAMGSSSENSALQKTYNPWNLKCVPGGSSGGSAAAVAARLCPLALGSDTGGSIRQPASLCGIVGLKPTYGRISRFGLVAFGSSLDQIGPFATCVEDAALVMEILGRHCEKDATSLQHAPDNLLSHLDTSVAHKKIGVPFSLLKEWKNEAKSVFEASLETYKRLGCNIVDIDLEINKYGIAVYYILANAEASTNLARFDGIRYGNRSPKAETLAELYDLSKDEGFGAEVKRRILLGTYVLSSGFQSAYYGKAQKVRTLMIEKYNKAFAKCDLILMPVCPSCTFEIGSIKDPLTLYLEDVYTIAANLVGVPAMSIPSGFSSDNKPIGLQLMAAQKKEMTLFQFAKAFQNENNAHKKYPEAYCKGDFKC